MGKKLREPTERTDVYRRALQAALVRKWDKSKKVGGTMVRLIGIDDPETAVMVLSRPKGTAVAYACKEWLEWFDKRFAGPVFGESDDTPEICKWVFSLVKPQPKKVDRPGKADGAAANRRRKRPVPLPFDPF